MTDIIKIWLKDRLGIIADTKSESFGNSVRDGRVFAELLYNYDIINYDQFISVVPTNDVNKMFNNLQFLTIWLQSIGIECDGTIVDEIAIGKTSAAIKLLYEIYLTLHDKDKLYFISQQRTKEKLRPINNRFTVTNIPEEVNDPSKNSINPLSIPLDENEGIVRWHRDRFDMLVEKCRESRLAYIAYLEEKFNRKNVLVAELDEEIVESPQELNSKFEIPPETTYWELVGEEKRNKDMPPLQLDAEVSKTIVENIKRKHRQETRDNKFKVQMETILLSELWQKLLSGQERDFEQLISKKMLKQSLYEKQMVTKLFDVRQQKDNILKNRQAADDEWQKKRDEEFMEQLFVRDKCLNDHKDAYYIERARILELHQRLYAEKLRLRAQRHYNLCLDALNDIVDISLRHAEYKNDHGEYPPQYLRKQLGDLFVKQQPIFDILRQIDDVILDFEDMPEEMEEIYCAELERQENLDQREFENYCNFDWPWTITQSKLDLFESDLHMSELGMNVLGHIVHRLLRMKYPKPALPPLPDIPKVNIAACINGITDPTILPVLQKLVDEKGVKILEIQEAINFCIQAYKDEITTEYTDAVIIEETTVALDNVKKKKIGKPKKDKKAESKKGEKTKNKNKKSNEKLKWQKSLVSEVALPPIRDEQNQTPRLFPCEEIILTPAAELGRLTSEIFDLGESLNDHIIVAMFVQYVITLKDIKGWALINFPTTMEQAAILEEALTGIPVPQVSKTVTLSHSIDEIAEVELRDSETLKKDKNENNRKSKILSDPCPAPQDIFYDTYLTAYITMIRNKDEGEPADLKHSLSDIGQAPQDPLEEFYADQGCNYAMNYQILDFAVIKHLAKLILGEYTVPPKTSLELFGDTFLYIQANLGQDQPTPGKKSKSAKKGNKKERPYEKSKKSEKESATTDGDKPGKKKGKNKKEKGSKKSKDKASKSKDSGSKKGKGKKAPVEIVAVTFEEKETQIPEPEPEEEIEVVELPPEPRAGEPNWQYVDLPLPEYFDIALATLWENCEDVYICDFKQLLFMRRVCLNAVVPYATSIKKHMGEYIIRPDNKQNYMYQFQTMYNEIDADLRDDVELKAEVHCRIYEFREKLRDICDHNMRESEEERKRLVREHWITAQACELTNIYSSAMQVEIDRCVDTLQLVMDFCSSIITKMPSDEPMLQKIQLPKIETGDSEATNRLYECLANVVENLLIQPDCDSLQNPLLDELDTLNKICSDAVAQWEANVNKAFGKMEEIFAPKVGKKDKKEKKPKSPKKEKGKKGETKLPKFLEPDPQVKEASSKILEEWKCILNGEILRVKLRVIMITELAKRELCSILSCMDKTFTEIYNNILKRYEGELSSVDTACEVLARALEVEMQLQAELVLEGDRFYIHPDILLFPEPLPPPAPSLKEYDLDYTFTIDQLTALTNILLDLSPSGIIPERTLVFLLQDMIVHKAEDEKEPMVPSIWTKLKPYQVSELSRKVFGNAEQVDWKDFVIYNLCINFPKEEELMSVRKQFLRYDEDMTETVKDYQFYNIKFWFENAFDFHDEQDMYRLDLIKKFLFKLFSTDWDSLNYTALLLYFCKDVNPVVGFAKALEVSLGQYVCWSQEIGKFFIENVYNQRAADDQAVLDRQLETEEAEARAYSVVQTLIDQSVHRCESLVLEEIDGNDEDIEKVEDQDEQYVAVKQDTALDKSCVDIEFTEMKKSNGSVAPSKESHNLEDAFSNVEIGFEPNMYAPKIYFLPFETLIKVCTAALPWHSNGQNLEEQSFRQCLEPIFEKLRKPDFNNAVFVHEFLNDGEFKDLLHQIYKFYVKDIRKMVMHMIVES